MYAVTSFFAYLRYGEIMPLIDFYFFSLSLSPFRAHTRGKEGAGEGEGGGDQTVLAMTNTYT